MSEGSEKVVCTSCGQLINVSDSYCPNCLTPASEVSNLDPMLAIESEGRLLTRAAEGRQKPIVLIGVWLLFMPMLLAAIFSAISILGEGIGSGAANFVFFWGAVGLAFIAFTVLYRVTRNYFGWTEIKRDAEDEEEITQLKL